MISVNELRKSFGEIRAVDGITFEVRDGEVFGLLGPNGAGKTTTISMISGVLRPEGGQVLVDERDVWTHPKEVKRRMGVVPQEISLYQELTAMDNLRFWGGLYGLGGSDLEKRIDELLDLAGLTDRARHTVKGFSGGMKRRLNLCVGMIHSPSMLLLDEPTVGIDPQARWNILEVVKRVAETGTTILYTTHYLEEAEGLCERVGIIDHGRIIAMGTVRELTLSLGEGRLLIASGGFSSSDVKALMQGGADERAALGEVRLVSCVDGRAVFGLPPEAGAMAFALEALLRSGLNISDLSIQEPSLESVFIKLTGRELRD